MCLMSFASISNEYPFKSNSCFYPLKLVIIFNLCAFSSLTLPKLNDFSKFALSSEFFIKLLKSSSLLRSILLTFWGKFKATSSALKALPSPTLILMFPLLFKSSAIPFLSSSLIKPCGFCKSTFHLCALDFQGHFARSF